MVNVYRYLYINILESWHVLCFLMQTNLFELTKSSENLLYIRDTILDLNT